MTMPLRFSIFLLLFLSGVLNAHAQDIPSHASARSLALAQSELADPKDEWSPDPAMREDTDAHLLTMLAPLPMEIPGTYTAGFNVDLPLDKGLEAGGAFTRYEFPDAHFAWESIGAQVSQTFQVAGSDSEVRFASVGLRLRYGEQILPPPYLPFEDITLDLGATFDLFPQLSAAAAATHLFSLYNNQNDSIEARTSWLGLTYRPTSDLAIDGALETMSGQSSLIFRGGIEYAFDRHLILRAGAVSGLQELSSTGQTSTTGEISAGFGVRTEGFSADFSIIRHPDLGALISFGLGFVL